MFCSGTHFCIDVKTDKRVRHECYHQDGKLWHQRGSVIYELWEECCGKRNRFWVTQSNHKSLGVESKIGVSLIVGAVIGSCDLREAVSP